MCSLLCLTVLNPNLSLMDISVLHATYPGIGTLILRNVSHVGMVSIMILMRESVWYVHRGRSITMRISCVSRSKLFVRMKVPTMMDMGVLLVHCQVSGMQRSLFV
jgi:hypothetical protein